MINQNSIKKISLIFISALLLNIHLLSQDYFETEPNNLPENANGVQVGDVIHGSTSVADVADYFSITLDQGGYLKLDIVKDPVYCPVWFIRILDAENGEETEITSGNMYWNNAINTIGAHLLKGTYFIKIDGAQGGCNYQLITSFLLPPLTEDEEPNDLPEEAIPYELTKVTTGNLAAYAAEEGRDIEDWYRLDLEQATNIHFDIRDEPEAWGAWWMSILDAEKEGIPEVGKVDLYWNTGLTALSVALLKGSYYIKFSDPTLYLNYKCTPTVTYPVYSSEPEPNNDSLRANILPLNDSITGTLRYYDPGEGRDFEDWYSIDIDKEGLLKLDITNAVSNANFWVYLRDGNLPDAPVINQVQFYWLNGNINKKMNRYLQPGKYYLQFANADRDFSYNIKSQFIPKPIADFSYEQVNNSLVFENLSFAATSNNWDLGDDNFSSATHPSHNYRMPGVFDVCLEVVNEAAKDTLCDIISVEGISSVTPERAGNIGYATLSIVGGGFSEDCKVWIEKDGIPLIIQDTTFLIARDVISVRMDLWNQPLGLYDLIVETGDGERYILPKSFTIEEGERPDPWVAVNGRNKILFNTPSTYNIQFGNRGNVDAYLVPLWIAISNVEDLDVRFSNASFLDTLLNEDSPEDLSEYFETDSLFGEQKNMRIYSFILPSISASSTNELSLKITTAENISIVAWVNDPYIQFRENDNYTSNESGKRNSQSNYNINVAICVAHLFSQVVENQNIELSDDDKTCIFESYAAHSLELFSKVSDTKISGALLWGGTGKSIPIKQHVKFNYAILKYCLGLGFITENKQFSYGLLLRVIRDQRKLNSEEVSSCLQSFCPNNDGFREDEECEECGTFCQKNICEKKLQAVSSFDPNEKTNISGFSEENYIKYQSTIPYAIYYENKDSATAPAHIVRIVDTLDKDKFDFSTFQFNSVTIGDSTVYVSPGQKKLLLDFLLSDLGVLARFNGRFDSLSGEVKWIIESLDPITMETIEDPEIGFLPPNINKPEGEGNVSFYIDLKGGLQNKEIVNNDALIYFDYNAPIRTNLSSFSLDLDQPESKVNDLSAEIPDTLIPVYWNGTDDESGVRLYDIYLSENGEEFKRWIARTNEKFAYFKGEIGNNYRFFSVAVDSVGLAEAFPDTWDAETNLVVDTKDHGIIEKSIVISPNPVRSVFSLDFYASNSRDVLIEVSNQFGQKVLKLWEGRMQTGKNHFIFNLNDIAEGPYLVTLSTPDNRMSIKLVKLDTR